MEAKMYSNSMKKKIIFGLTAFLLTSILFWVYSHSYIVLDVSNVASTTEITYTFTEKRSNISIEYKSQDSRIRRLVARGDYTVAVRQGETSALSQIHTGGFLATTTLSQQLSPEKNRIFIGNNPNTCMHNITSVLASYPCGGDIDTLNIHVPATGQVPTYTKGVQGPAGLIEGIVNSKQGSLVLVRLESEVPGEGNYHAIYSISATGVLLDESAHTISELKGNKQYQIKAYGDGFVIYNLSGAEFLELKSPTGKAEKLTLSQPDNKAFKPIGLEVSGKSIMTIYSDVNSYDKLNLDDSEGVKTHGTSAEKQLNQKSTKTEIFIQDNGQTKQLNFGGTLIKAHACGSDQLCLLKERGKLEVYDISEQKQKLLYELGSVLDIEESSNGLIVVRNEGVYLFDTTKKTGYMEYSFGDDYGYCGIKMAEGFYTVCVTDQSGKRLALRIDQTTPNADSIDKKIAKLAGIAEIKTVSAYGTFIHVSAELGELDFRESIGGYGYDPAIIKSTNTAIDAAIKQLGIDTSKYTIVNPYR
jgi:hypothetical protein